MGNKLPQISQLPHPCPLPEGEGAKSTHSETGTIQSPLPLGEGKGEGVLRETIPAHMIELAKKLRKSQTDAEKFIWQLLRNRQVANAKFRRQHPIEGYIADFYCHEQKLVVELDGSQHFTKAGFKKDAARTQRLNKLGVSVLRFDNRQVLLETEVVLQMIYNAVKRPHPNPLPEGEGAKITHSETGTIQSLLSQSDDLVQFAVKSPLPLGEGKGEGVFIRQNLEVLGYGE